MTARINSDIGSGALFAGLGAFALYVSSSYPKGTMARLGPGAFAMGVALCLVAIGVALLIRGFVQRQPGVSFGALRKPLIALAATAAFALALQPLGFIIATFLLVMITWLIERGKHALEPFVMFAVLCGFIAVVFIVGLGIDMHLWIR